MQITTAQGVRKNQQVAKNYGEVFHCLRSNFNVALPSPTTFCAEFNFYSVDFIFLPLEIVIVFFFKKKR